MILVMLGSFTMIYTNYNAYTCHCLCLKSCRVNLQLASHGLMLTGSKLLQCSWGITSVLLRQPTIDEPNTRLNSASILSSQDMHFRERLKRRELQKQLQAIPEEGTEAFQL